MAIHTCQLLVTLLASWILHGAEANALPVSDYNKLLNRPPLKPTDIKLTAYGGSSINPIGTCILQCSSKDKSHNVKFYVVTVDSEPILGLKDCE